MRPRTTCKSLKTLLLAAAVLTRGGWTVLQADTFVRGDINGDGQVSLTDICYYLDARYLGAAPPKCEDALDVNDSGQLDLQGDIDALYLYHWLFRASSQPAPPFPKPGADPTTDGLKCDDGLIAPPGNPKPGYEILPDRDLSVKPGEKNVETFILASTAAPIECFSIAYRVDRRFAENIRVDLEGTIIPSSLRQAFIGSGFFRVMVTQSASSTHDLLLVGAVFLLPAGQQNLVQDGGGGREGGGGGGGVGYQRMLFDATKKPIRRQPLLRIVLDVRADAPAGEEAAVLLPAPAADYVLGEGALHGIRNEFGGSIAELTGATIIPVFLGDGFWVALDGGEFLRADANADRCVDISDASSTLNYLFSGGASPRCPDASDSNDDGRVDISDPVFTLNFLFLGGPSPPARAGGDLCAYDETDDALGPCEPQCGFCLR